jgi:hypothetical protein
LALSKNHQGSLCLILPAINDNVNVCIWAPEAVC